MNNNFLKNYKNKEKIFTHVEESLLKSDDARGRVTSLRILILALSAWGSKANDKDHNRTIKLIKKYDNPHDYGASIWYITLVNYACELLPMVVDVFYKNKFKCDDNFASCLIADYMLTYYKKYTSSHNFIKYKEFILNNDPGAIQTMQHFISLDNKGNNSNYTMNDFYYGLSSEYKLGVIL